MSTLPPPKTKEFPESSLEKKVYGIVSSLSTYLPVANDRNRLGFGLYKYMSGEGDPPEVLVKTSKLRLEGITFQDLAKIISQELEKIK